MSVTIAFDDAVMSAPPRVTALFAAKPLLFLADYVNKLFPAILATGIRRFRGIGSSDEIVSPAMCLDRVDG
jgi:hypothetical protein